MGWCNGTGTCFASKDGKTQYFDELVANRILFYKGESNNTYYFPSHSEDELTNSQAGDESTNDVLNNKVQSEKKKDYMPPLEDSDVVDLNGTWPFTLLVF